MECLSCAAACDTSVNNDDKALIATRGAFVCKAQRLNLPLSTYRRASELRRLEREVEIEMFLRQIANLSDEIISRLDSSRSSQIASTKSIYQACKAIQVSSCIELAECFETSLHARDSTGNFTPLFRELDSLREMKLLSYELIRKLTMFHHETSFRFLCKLLLTVSVTHIYCGSVSVSCAWVIKKTFPSPTINVDELSVPFNNPKGNGKLRNIPHDSLNNSSSSNNARANFHLQHRFVLDKLHTLIVSRSIAVDWKL